VALADSDGQGNTVGWWLKPVVLIKPTLPVGGSSRLCWSSHNCRLVALACCVGDGNTVRVVAQAGSDGFNNTNQQHYTILDDEFYHEFSPKQLWCNESILGAHTDYHILKDEVLG
jgi:hypothetical protein